eukprot:TRINITY_DN2900_c0_g1_i6.p1 TRINITY_DN2900_c0_g1~~TRINITY_DN2900_c0_g1_i6.p1  ORF type:complete len:411 (+),score=61.66 TRINITY_DN2900_c0_g1_i6:764-1996(+)
MQMLGAMYHHLNVNTLGSLHTLESLNATFPVDSENQNSNHLENREDADSSGTNDHPVTDQLFPNFFSFNSQLIHTTNCFFEKNFSHKKVELTTLEELYLGLKEIHRKILCYDKTFDLHKSHEPMWLVRNWLLILFGSIGCGLVVKYTSIHFQDIKEFVIQTTETVKAFVFSQWTNLMNAIETIRYEQNVEMMEFQASAVKASEESLGRMVMEYNKQRLNIPPEMAENISVAAKFGDLSSIMPAYEKELEQPLRGAIFGDFVRLVLIQVQKQKVDIERAMLQLDKLLRSNELNFAMLALLPAMLVCYLIYLVLTRDRSDPSINELLRETLRQVHFLLNKSNRDHATMLSYEEYGRLIISLNKLRYYATFLKGKTREWMLQDLYEIETETYTITQRITTISRMYGTYVFLKV